MTRERTTLVVVGLLTGAVVGWLANETLGSRYVMHIEAGRWLINSRTGRVWLLECDPKPCHWTPIPDSSQIEQPRAVNQWHKSGP